MNVQSTAGKHLWKAKDVKKSTPDAHLNANTARTVSGLKERAEVVASIAAETAVTVDRDARFPHEAFAAARSQRLLGVMVPHDLGGEGASLTDVLDVCYILGRACASTGMIYAMHQTKMALVLRHGCSSPWHRRLLRRLSEEQLLLASLTTEGQRGGDVRNSVGAIEAENGRIALVRDATVISYGQHADGIVTTARRSPDAAPSDQVLVVFLKQQYSLHHLTGWDTLGMRGTCSSGFRLHASGESGQILPEPYEKIHGRTMLPVAHLTWSACWTGIAAGAVERARLFIRNAGRAGAALPPGSAHLTRANASLRTLRALVTAAAQRFEAAACDVGTLEAVDFQTSMNLLKVNASELATATVMSALQASGLPGYRNDGDFSIGRYLRDILSAPIMINNDRILANVASASMLSQVPNSLRD